MSSCFVGDFHAYGASGARRWGGGYVVNERRSAAWPLQRPYCSFCALAAEPAAPRSLIFHDEEYWALDDANPVVRGEVVLAPRGSVGSPFPRHRCDPRAVDFLLLDQLMREGWARRAGSPASPRERFALYVNPLPGSGRVEEHLHVHLLPSGRLPLPRVRRADLPVARGMGRARLWRLEGLSYYGLAVHGPDTRDVALTLERLHEVFNCTLRRAYNLIAFPSGPLRSADYHLAIVPRRREYCPAAGQRLGGLELLTGVLMSGARARSPLTPERRDRALQEATLSPSQALALEQRLTRMFRVPLAL